MTLFYFKSRAYLFRPQTALMVAGCFVVLTYWLVFNASKRRQNCDCSQSFFSTILVDSSSSHDHRQSSPSSTSNYDEIITTTSTANSSSLLSSSSSSSKSLTEPKDRPPLLPLCPDPAPKLVGPLAVAFEAPSFGNISEINPDVKLGGQFRPKDCMSRHARVAVIVPYRDREMHLKAFLHHIHPILQRQQLDYRIIVIEQAGNSTFNKALLMNIAFKESLKLFDSDDFQSQFQCYIFHDVDLFSEDDRGLYVCREFPFHFSEYLNHLNYEPYTYVDVLFGGAVAIPRRHFELANGYSNVFFGWGAEDEDMRWRFGNLGIPIIKADNNVTYRYRMFIHGVDPGNPHDEHRVDLLYSGPQRMHRDGLNSLTYKLISHEDQPLYTHFLVEFNQEDVLMASTGKPTIT